MSMARTAEELIAIAERGNSREIIGIMRDQDGWEFIEASAEMFARVSQAVQAYRDSLTAGRAKFGAYSVARVSIAREGAAVASLPVGTILQGRTGLRFTMTDAVSLGVGELGPKYANIVARAKTTHGNMLVGEKLFVAHSPDPTNFDHTFIATVVSAGGGWGPALELLGLDKGLYPTVDESLQAFRKRFRELNNFASLPVVLDLVHQYFATGQVHEIADCGAFADRTAYTWDWDWQDYRFSGSMALEVPTNGFIVLIPYQVETSGTWCYTDRDAYADRSYCGVENLVSLDLGDGRGTILVDIGQGSVYAEAAALEVALDTINNAGIWFVVQLADI